jgi:hypothetical protein
MTSDNVVKLPKRPAADNWPLQKVLAQIDKTGVVLCVVGGDVDIAQDEDTGEDVVDGNSVSTHVTIPPPWSLLDIAALFAHLIDAVAIDQGYARDDLLKEIVDCGPIRDANELYDGPDGHLGLSPEEMEIAMEIATCKDERK